MNNKLTGLGANHPANGPLTIERLSHVRDVLQRNLKYSNGGGMSYIIADAVKAIDELLAGRKEEPVAWTDEQELRDVEKDGLGYLFTVNPITPHADPRRVIKLYRHAQPAPVADDWLVDAKRLAELHGTSFVVFRHGDEPQCADPTKVVISLTDKG